MVACLGLVVIQLVNIQLVKAKQLQTSPFNPRVAAQKDNNARGNIYAADGTLLATSVPRPAGTNRVDYPYDYVRQYPQGPLYAGITGYDSVAYYGTTGIEEQYDSYLSAHQQPPQTLSQLLFREKLPTVTNNVTLTVQPKLQQAAWNALTATPGNNDGAVVVLDPKTGAVLAMVSNPTYDPNALVSTSVHAENLAYFSYIQKDHEGYFPLRPIATREFFFPGSTMKVVTSTAAYNLKPSLAGFNYPVQQCQTFPDSNKQLCDQSGPCGGTMVQMLPFSCDPGYGELGRPGGRGDAAPAGPAVRVQLGAAHRPARRHRVDRWSLCPPTSQAFQAYTAIGQFGVQDTALQNAMVAAGIANGGTAHDAAPDVEHPRLAGADTCSPTPRRRWPRWRRRRRRSRSSRSWRAWSPAARRRASASPATCAPRSRPAPRRRAPGQSVNHDWMIGLAPANDPKVAVAVVVPQQNISSDGAGVAGSDHEGRPRGGAAAGVGQPALQRAGPARLGLHLRALSRRSPAASPASPARAAV